MLCCWHYGGATKLSTVLLQQGVTPLTAALSMASLGWKLLGPSSHR